MKLIKLTLAAVTLVFAQGANALLITPADCGPSPTYPCETGTQTSNSAIVAYINANYGVTELYKQNVGGGESGILASSYTTTFSNSASDPEDALVKYDGGDACTACYLLVKDGNNDPAWYFFDIRVVWNGTEDLVLEDFWVRQGAISHVSLFGATHQIPAPGVLAMLALGLIGIAAVRRRA